MPSAFTPNNDGLNDIFRVKHPFPVKQFNLVIYNRWGQRIFQSSDIYKGWVGSYKSQALSRDTFVWMINYIGMDDKKSVLHGLVTLLR